MHLLALVPAKITIRESQKVLKTLSADEELEYHGLHALYLCQQKVVSSHPLFSSAKVGTEVIEVENGVKGAILMRGVVGTLTISCS